MTKAPLSSQRVQGKKRLIVMSPLRTRCPIVYGMETRMSRSILAHYLLATEIKILFMTEDYLEGNCKISMPSKSITRMKHGIFVPIQHIPVYKNLLFQEPG